MPLLPVSTAQSTNVLFWVCPCNKMRANPLHSTHIHTRIRFFDSPPFDIIWYHLRLCTRLLLLLPKYVWSRSNEIRSSTVHNQTKKMLKLLPTSSMLLSSKQYCLGCYVCKKNNVWYKGTKYLDIYKYNQWMNQHWFFQYNATFYARAIIFTFYQILITKNGWTLKTVDQIWTNIYFIMQSYHEFQIGTDVWLNLRKGKENFLPYTFIDFFAKT